MELIIKSIEFKLNTLKYSDAERNRIIDLTNKEYNLIYDKTRKKFQNQLTISKYGIILHKSLSDVVKDD